MATEPAVLTLTGHECNELHAMLYMILTNPDQWSDTVDLSALRRADDKLVDALIRAVNAP